ncbi:MAG: methyltransferase domain-containing protein [Deltaproteobacteria bacterium]|nr:methyltransferase domain-containing protein [Deltaproteobacteria bacterium]
MASKDPKYIKQERGTLTAYSRYLDGMDASMKQKIALAAAHLLCSGKVADMGMGSGTGSEALAALYPNLTVTGVDINEAMVHLAQKRYQRPNLTFIHGDIANPVFPPESLNAIVNSSVFHHVTSFNNYNYNEIPKAVACQCTQLKENGIILIRDFIAPEDKQVFLDVLSTDGDNSFDPDKCSTANLFRRFSGEFKSLSPKPGFKLLQAVDNSKFPIRRGFDRFQCSLRIATEFLLRKDYRNDWDIEVKEEYTYFTKRQFEDLFHTLGLRVLASTPINNPWIVKNRFEGQAYIWNTNGEPLPFPPTNYIIAGEKINKNDGVMFKKNKDTAPVGFLEMSQFRHKETGQILDLIRRPNRTIDIIPWFNANSDLFILVRKGYPRPVLQAWDDAGNSISKSSPVGYVIEPLNMIQTDQPLGSSVEKALNEKASIPSINIIGFEKGSTYYPSPGGILEEVCSAFVNIVPTYTSTPLKDLSGYSTSQQNI